MKLKLIYEDVTTANFGKQLKRALHKPEAFAILDANQETSGGTFTQGGCYVLAWALNILIPKSDVYGIYRDNGLGILPNGYADHFVIKIDNLYYDSNGEQSEAEILNYWNGETRNPAIKKANMVSDVHPETSSRRSIMTQIKNYLLSDAAFVRSLNNINK